MKMLKKGDFEKLKDKYREEGRISGFQEGIEHTLTTLVQSHIVIFDEDAGYGAAMKIPINLVDDDRLVRLIIELVAKAPHATEEVKKMAKGFAHLAQA